MNRHGKQLLMALVLATSLGGVPVATQAESLKVHSIDDIRYVSGGVGKSEQLALRQAKPEYNLHLPFAHTGGAFLARVPVTISGE